MRRYKVRFHLSKGVNFRKWQVKDTLTNEVGYYEPENTIMYLYDCVIVNNERVAREIFNGRNKTVCAWISCETIDIRHIENKCDVVEYMMGVDGYEITYNPRNYYHWVDTTKDKDFAIDNKEISLIYINKRKLIVPKKIR